MDTKTIRNTIMASLGLTERKIVEKIQFMHRTPSDNSRGIDKDGLFRQYDSEPYGTKRNHFQGAFAKLLAKGIIIKHSVTIKGDPSVGRNDAIVTKFSLSPVLMETADDYRDEYNKQIAEATTSRDARITDAKENYRRLINARPALLNALTGLEPDSTAGQNTLDDLARILAEAGYMARTTRDYIIYSGNFQRTINTLNQRIAELDEKSVSA